MFGQGSGNLRHIGQCFPSPSSYVHFSPQYSHSHGRFVHKSACRFKQFTSPTQSHPLSLCQQCTRTSWTLRRWYLSNMALHCSALHMGQAFPSLCSLVEASSDRWWPQHDVSCGSNRSSKETGQKKSCEGRSTKSKSPSMAVAECP